MKKVLAVMADKPSFTYLTESSLQADGTIKAEIARVGDWVHGAHGKISITMDGLKNAIKNFKANVLGRPISATIEHNDELGALTEVHDVILDGDKLYSIEKLKEGVDKNELVKRPYSSIEYLENYKSKDDGKTDLGFTLTGLTRTIKPFIPNLSPIVLSENMQTVKLSESQSDSVARPASTHDQGASNQEDERKRKEHLKMDEDVKTLTEAKTKLESDNAKLLSEKTAQEAEIKKLSDQIVKAEADKKLSERITRISAMQSYPFIKKALQERAEGKTEIKLSEKSEPITFETDLDFAIGLFEQMPEVSKLLSEKEIKGGVPNTEETPDEKAKRLSEVADQNYELVTGKKGK